MLIYRMQQRVHIQYLKRKESTLKLLYLNLVHLKLEANLFWQNNTKKMHNLILDDYVETIIIRMLVGSAFEVNDGQPRDSIQLKRLLMRFTFTLFCPAANNLNTVFTKANHFNSKLSSFSKECFPSIFFSSLARSLGYNSNQIFKLIDFRFNLHQLLIGCSNDSNGTIQAYFLFIF